MLFNHQNATYAILDQLLEKGLLRAIDKAFGLFLAEGARTPEHELDWTALIGALASQQLGQQHTCMDIRRLPLVWASHVTFPAPRQLYDYLVNDPRVSRWQRSDAPEQSLPNQPLVLDGPLLYLHKYWLYETQLLERLVYFSGQHTAFEEGISLAGEAATSSPMSQGDALHNDLAMLFPRTDALMSDETDWQKVAVAVAALKPFCIITGGPGTGKTTTVAKLLWLLTKQHQNKEFVVRLAAPTGKAAARLTESLRGAANQLPGDVSLPDECTTIHRLLGVKRHSSQFHHHQGNPLKLDMLIVDEASMIDLPLLSKLFDAIPNHARVVLLGDNNQLASVEVGSVLGDICGVKPHASVFSPQMTQQLQRLTDNTIESQPQLPHIANNLVHLQKSYRFDENSGIGQLAKAINLGNVPDTMNVLQHPRFSDVTWHSDMQHSTLIETVSDHWQRYFEAANKGDADTVFSLLTELQILCMQRAGPWGIESLNVLFEQHFNRQGWVNARTEYYPGRPIMIVENDHRLGLYNGDIGVVLPNMPTKMPANATVNTSANVPANASAQTPQTPQTNMDQNESLLRVWFIQSDGTYQHFLSGQLPKHETVYAMTTHKSQGSEFKRVVLCMPAPETDSQRSLLSRELLYTGVTRAKSSFVLMAEYKGIDHAVKQRCIRASGLVERLIKSL